MIRICMDCKTVMGEKEPIEDKRETHGCCPECLKKREDQIDLMRLLGPNRLETRAAWKR